MSAWLDDKRSSRERFLVKKGDLYWAGDGFRCEGLWTDRQSDAIRLSWSTAGRYVDDAKRLGFPSWRIVHLSGGKLRKSKSLCAAKFAAKLRDTLAREPA